MGTLLINMDLFRSGDYSTFKQVFDFYYPGICFYYNKMTKKSGVTKDLANDLFLHVWEVKEKFIDPDHLKAFLYRSAKNSYLNYRRHLKAVSSFVKYVWYNDDIMEMPRSSQELIHTLLINMLYDKIETFPPMRRKIMLLMYTEGLKINQIANKLHLSINTIKEQLRQGRNILRDLCLNTDLSSLEI